MSEAEALMEVCHLLTEIRFISIFILAFLVVLFIIYAFVDRG